MMSLIFLIVVKWEELLCESLVLEILNFTYNTYNFSIILGEVTVGIAVFRPVHQDRTCFLRN